MVEYFIKVSPILSLGLIGFILKKINFFNTSHANLFLKMVFYIAMPGLIFSSFDKFSFIYDLLYLPLIAAVTLLFNFSVSIVIGKIKKLPRKTFGTFVLGASILNTGFSLPFIITFFGEIGTTRWIMFDIGNVTLVLTLLYYFACKIGSDDFKIKTVLFKFSTSVPLIALFLSIVLNINEIHLPEFFLDLSEKTGNLVIPLLMISLGIYFNPKLYKLKLLFTTLFIRMGFGFIIGFFFSYLFNLDGIEHVVVIVCASAPIGFNALIFSSLENLDIEFAANLISFAIGIGMITVPTIMYILTV